MTGLRIPPQLLGAFRSKIPTAEEMRLGGVTDWGAGYIANSATWIQSALARHWSLPDIEIPAGAQGLLDVVPTAVDAVATWQNAEGGAKLSAIGAGAYAAIDAALSGMKATAGSVPIIGAVAQVGLAAQEIFWTRWLASVQPHPAPPGLKYDRGTDEKVQQDALDLIGSQDVTRAFLPFVDLTASKGEIEFRRVQDLTVEKEREWLVLPQGPALGLGFMPGGLGIPRSWQGLGGVLWSDYAPGSLAASIAAWELATGSLAPHVDFDRIAAEWFTFWSWIQKAANELDAKYKETGEREFADQRNVLERALRPVHLGPGPKVGQRIHGDRHMGFIVRDIVQEDRPGGSGVKRAKIRGAVQLPGGRSVSLPAIAAGGAGLLWLLSRVIK